MSDQFWLHGEPLHDMGSKIEVVKFGHVLPISEDMAMDYGIIPDTRPPLPPLPHRTRLHWWLREWWSDHRPVLHFGPCDHDDCY